MVGPFELPAERRHSHEAWAALAWGAADLAANPIPDEEPLTRDDERREYLRLDLDEVDDAPEPEEDW